MELDQRARNGKAEPAALMALGELVLDLLEGPAELGDIGLGNADAGVPDGNFDVAARARQMHIDAAAIAGEFDRVREQVEEYLLERTPVCLERQVLRPVA